LKKHTKMNKSCKKVLIIAYACEPNRTSEPGVGWHFTKEISNSFNTIVLTRKNNKNAIEKVKNDKREFLYYDLPFFFKKLKKNLPLGTQLYYIIWQWGAYLYAKKLIENSNISVDLLHHLNFGISWITPPAFLFKIPFIWGPIGGGDFIPLSFLKQMTYKSILQESFYYILNKFNKISFFSFLTRKKAKVIIFRTSSAKQAFPFNKDKLYSIISETAYSDIIPKIDKTHNDYIHALCIGRMAYWKGFSLAVKGFHSFIQNGGKGKLELFGEGPELKKIKMYIKDNNLENYIFVRGFVINNDIKNKLKEASILLHPSFRDGGSWSIIESMSNGLPVICLNASGPKDMVTDKGGLLIDVISPNQVVEDIGKGLLELLNDPIKYKTLSIYAQKRINTEYTWKKRGEQMKKVYEDVLNKI